MAFVNGSKASSSSWEETCGRFLRLREEVDVAVESDCGTGAGAGELAVGDMGDTGDVAISHNVSATSVSVRSKEPVVRVNAV